MRVALCLLAFAIAISGFAHAQVRRAESYRYFNQPGSTLQQQREAIDSCIAPTLALIPPTNTNTSVSDPADQFTLIGVLRAEAARRREWLGTLEWLVGANIENCMIVKGWRVVEVDPQSGRTLSRLRVSELATRMQAMIAAEQPEGRIVREFVNQLTPAAVLPPNRNGVISLSARATGLEREIVRRIREANGRAVRITIAPPYPTATAKSVDLLADDTSFISVTAQGGTSLMLFRSVDAGFSIVVAAPEGGGTSVYPVTPGRWRLSSVIIDGIGISLCLGAPAFDVGRGEVVFAGAFVMGDGAFMPDLSSSALDVARTAVPEAASRVRGAEWVNGVTADCSHSAFIYAHEIPGAPFVEGYTGGTQARR